ncbi:hypothetical protein CSUI_002659 [Cystoisospora suis]|uniref:Uncharacterized protein n=1 Tax=Cystoisospora suis TaxID=483139 RepID=A0A2C6KT45_9APIC|nr:hypothetical protein CSUI_002659 [Cystoisospora suis]
MAEGPHRNANGAVTLLLERTRSCRRDVRLTCPLCDGTPLRTLTGDLSVRGLLCDIRSVLPTGSVYSSGRAAAANMSDRHALQETSYCRKLGC